MYGALEGIRAGASDARAANELAAQNAYRAQMLAMQQAQERRAQQEFDMRVQDRQRVTGAMDRVQGLYDQDTRFQGAEAARADDFEAADKANLQGLPMPKYDAATWQQNTKRPTERDFNSAYSGLALAKGDIGTADQFRGKNKMLDVADAAKAKAADPEFQKKVFDYVHKDKRFLGQFEDAVIDPKTGRVTTPAKFRLDGGKEITLTDQDKYQFAYGAALMEAGMTDEGMKVISGVNKELGALVDKANQQMTGAAAINRQASNDMLDHNVKLDQMASQAEYRRMLIAQRKAAAGPREADPKLVKEFNDLYVQYEAALAKGDKQGAASINQMMAAKQAQIATSLGKTMQVRDPQPKQTMSPMDEMKFLSDATQMFSGTVDPKLAPQYAQTLLAVRKGELTAEMVAEAVKGDTPEAQKAEVLKAKAIDPTFGARVQALLVRQGPAAAAAPAKKGGLPPPVQSSAPNGRPTSGGVSSEFRGIEDWWNRQVPQATQDNMWADIAEGRGLAHRWGRWGEQPAR